MRNVLTLAILLISPAALLAADDEAVKKELKALAGQWKSVEVELGGEKNKDVVISVTFTADGKAVAETPDGKMEGPVTLGPDKTPKTMTMDHSGGVQKGKKQYGIYKIDGDKLIVVMSSPGSEEKDRPKDFATKNTTHMMLTFERVKK